jgi:hypothetical protein
VEATADSLKTDADVSPAELMKRALSQAPVAPAEKDGFNYTAINGDGTAETTVMKYSDIQQCPNLIMLPSHYNEDGSCQCEQPAADVQQPKKGQK